MQNSNNNNRKHQNNGQRSKRGLASASKETRERVASEGGRASGEARREGHSNSGNGNSGGNGGNR